MAIIPLGQMGSPRESPLADVADTFVSVYKKRLELENKSKNTAAILEAERKSKDKERVLKIVKSVNQIADPGQRELIRKNPDLVNLVKGVAPELVNDNAIVDMPTKTKPMSPDEAAALKVKTRYAIEKVKRGLPPTIAEASAAVQSISLMRDMGTIDDNQAIEMSKPFTKYLQAERDTTGNQFSDALQIFDPAASNDTNIQDWLKSRGFR